jgi:3',5'-cyclic AMP phosphodiesterase CpdA
MTCFEPLQGEELGPDAVRICHLADLHLPLPRPIRPWHLLNKRVLGYLNLRLGRSTTHKLSAFEELLDSVAAEGADLTVIVGDVANLSLDFEYEAIGEMLRAVGLEPDNTVVIPGNHDRYTITADSSGAFEQGMAEWLPPGFSRSPAGYPFVQVAGPVELIALDTAVWRGPIRAAGRIDPDQIERTVAAVDRIAAAGRWPVIAMHHPPFRLDGALNRHYRTGLVGYDDFVEALDGRSATVLHGHLHYLTRRSIAGLDVIGAPSASNDCGRPDHQLAYCLYTFDRSGLTAAEVVRLWPDRGGESRIERASLPDPEGG